MEVLTLENRVISAGSTRVFVRPWADGQVLLMTADENLKKELLGMRSRGEGVELLTDPEMRVDAADLDGAMCAVVDPRKVMLCADLETLELTPVCCMPEPFMDEEDEP